MLICRPYQGLQDYLIDILVCCFIFAGHVLIPSEPGEPSNRTEAAIVAAVVFFAIVIADLVYLIYKNITLNR